MFLFLQREEFLLFLFKSIFYVIDTIKRRKRNKKKARQTQRHTEKEF